MVHLELVVDVETPAEFAWNSITDWPRQGEWMLGTKVWQTTSGPNSVGTQIAAFTGLWKIGFLDTMTITNWLPPKVCDVQHTGKVVRGTGRFEIQAVDATKSKFIWIEDLVIPLGLVGRLGFGLIKPLFLLGIKRSLLKFAQQTRAEFKAQKAS